MISTCCWPLPARRNSLGLRIAVEAQRLVFFQDPVDGVAHAIFVVARLG